MSSTHHMIFPIPRLIEHVSSIMTLEVRVWLFSPFFFLLGDYTPPSIISFSTWLFLLFFLDWKFLSFFLLALLFHKVNQTRLGRRLDSYRNTKWCRPRFPRRWSGMRPKSREWPRTDQTGVFCCTKGRWLLLPTWLGGLRIDHLFDWIATGLG